MKKHQIIIYEGVMCCPTGICGPEPNKELMALTETLKRIQDEYGDRVTLMRASLTFNSLIFMSHPEIARLVKENGQDILPITTINDEIVARQRYLSYDELKKSLEEKIKIDQRADIAP